MISRRRFASLPEALEHWAGSRPERIACEFLATGEQPTARISYRQLHAAALNWAEALRQHGAATRPVLILLPSGIEFIGALFGCFIAGSPAVPLYPPGVGQPAGRLRTVSEHSGARWAITSPELVPTIEPLLGPGMSYITSEGSAVAGRRGPSLAETALIQYTSGSTGSPKGVTVSHENLIANQLQIAAAFGTRPDSVIVGWLPLFHDMGLIGNVLHTVFMGAQAVLMPPLAALQKPVRWLRAIAAHQADISGGPNFIFDYCVRRISRDSLEGIDLSCWRVAFCGSETVRPATLDEFARSFSPNGFAPTALFPCYGLAEATLFVSGGFYRPETNIGSAVSCGRCYSEVKIVGPETGSACAEGETGEIWISGLNVATGYWADPASTATAFGETLAGKSFLRTGDLGFVQDGELYVTGRLKDMMIIRGRNLYPEDVEGTVRESLKDLDGSLCAAFSVESDNAETLIIIKELEMRSLRTADRDNIIGRIRQAISTEHQAQAHDIVLVRRGTLPRTSSGKLQRHACRKLYMEGRLGGDA